MKKTCFPAIESIILLKADSNYTVVKLHSGKKMVLSQTLKRYSKNPYFFSFIRIHKSCLVNPFYIKKIIRIGRQHFICLENGEIENISRRKWSYIRNLKFELIQ